MFKLDHPVFDDSILQHGEVGRAKDLPAPLCMYVCTRPDQKVSGPML